MAVEESVPINTSTQRATLAVDDIAIGAGGAVSRPKLLIVSSNWIHMGRHSGFSPLADHLSQWFEVVRVAPNKLDRTRAFLRRMLGVVRKKLFSSGAGNCWSPFYDINRMIAELAAIRLAKQQRFDCVLFESVEDLFCHFKKSLKANDCPPLVGFSHHPPAWWKLFAEPNAVLPDFDLVFALSENAQTFLSANAEGTPVRFVHHGVDASFFSPSKEERLPLDDAFHVVFCGKWLRDFPTLLKVVQRAAELPKPLVVHMVVPRFGRNMEQHYELATRDNVVWHSGLSDSQLLSLYRSSHMLFMPMIDATANNAVLEAMACGLPIAVSRVGGIPDYLDDSMATYFPAGDVDAAVQALGWCMENYPQCAEKAALARKKVESTLVWQQVAARVAEGVLSVCVPQREGVGK